jgi:hypothetical protein
MSELSVLSVARARVNLLQGYLETIHGEQRATLIAKIVERRPTTVDIS